jgi:hypothetical protein
MKKHKSGTSAFVLFQQEERMLTSYVRRTSG